MTQMEATSRLVKIPELVSLVGQYLTKHDLALCIRVNKAWFDAYSPLLYHTISIVDFELNSLKLRDPPTTTGATTTSTSKDQVPKVPEYGNTLIHRYCHLIQSITVVNIHALTYLGDEAVNLTHIGVNVNLETTTLIPTLSGDANERLCVDKFWHYFRNGNVIIPIWVALIHRNPNLKSVCIDLSYCDQGTERIVRALGEGAKHLEEVVLWRMTQTNTMELFLDHCPHILSLTASCEVRDSGSLEGPDQIFRESSGFDTLTKIRHLSIHCNDPWVTHVLRRCPDLEDLTIPALAANVYVAIIKEVTRLSLSKFFTLRNLSLTISPRRPSLPIEKVKTTVANLLNSCCAQLVSLTITDSKRMLSQSMVQLDSSLWSRLEEFRYISKGSYTQHAAAPTDNLCNLLALCPNLRVFEVSNTMIAARDFLQTEIICFQSLTSLKLTVCASFPQSQTAQPQLQPPPWLTTLTVEQAQMATMAQFELPLQPLSPPVIAADTIVSSKKKLSTQAARVYSRILEFSELRTLDFGSQVPFSMLRFITLPTAEGEDECVSVFKEGLPRLLSLRVRDISFD
ncbi:hypothetical protein EC991_003036 [Linnemannia zychae]|nr:hypothetical protein EC991_003036 [Linnemannia zychae]